ncbi:hypothetical protein [Microbacterium schleiferi]|uniref:Uncharacterized protein n=1 Tax=Microbacterium schleiferi TaxID=69362 RepID=A0ABU7V4E0_9MICO|nr:hypothetical protein [Micrococcales bacterium]
MNERYSLYEATHATACYVLAAALAAVIISIGLPAHLDPATGEPLLWWQKSSHLFTRFLPWVLIAAVVFPAPVMHLLRTKTPVPIAVILSALVGTVPAILFLVVCLAIPPLASQAPLAFPLLLFGVMVSLVGFAIHAAVREHLALILTAAGVVTVGGLVTSAVAG